MGGLGAGGGGGMIVSHTRVVSQTDLHSRLQGTLGSLKPDKVGEQETPSSSFHHCHTLTTSSPFFFYTIFFAITGKNLWGTARSTMLGTCSFCTHKQPNWD